MRRLAMPVVLASVLALSALLSPSVKAEASPGGETVTVDLCPGYSLSFELPLGYQVVNWIGESGGEVEGPRIQLTTTYTDGSSMSSESYADSFHFSVISRKRYFEYSDLSALVREQISVGWESVFREETITVPGDGSTTYSGYYALIFIEYDTSTTTEGHLVVLMPDCIATLDIYVSDLKDEVRATGTIVNHTINGQSPITKHKTDIADMIASVKITGGTTATVGESPSEEAVLDETSISQETAIAVIVEEVRGEVYIREAGSASWIEVSPAEKNILIREGSVIRTYRGSVYIKNLAGHEENKMFIGEDTEVHIREQVTKLDILIGIIRVWIKKLGPRSKYEIYTPVSSGGVRGTDFIVDTTSEKTDVLVFEGTVEVSDLEGQKTVLVKAGESSVVMSGGAPSDPQRYDITDVYQKYQALFESEEEIKAIIGDIEYLAEDRETGGFPYYFLAIPAAAVAAVIIILVMRRRRRA